MEFGKSISRFRMRVRLLRAWRFGMLGLFAGSLIALLATGADRLGWIEFLPMWSVIPVAGLLVIGAILGALWPTSDLALARSVDRRTGNFDRLGSALQTDESETFAPLLAEDARQSIETMHPRSVFPFRWRRIDFAACGSCLVLSAAIYALQTDLLLSPGQKVAKKEMERVSAQVERVVRDLEKQNPSDPELKKLAAELRRFERDLERGKIGKEEALQKAQQLADEAKQLTAKRIEKAAEKADRIQARVLQEQFEKAGGDLGALKDLKLDRIEQMAMREMMEKSGASKMPSENLDEKILKSLGMDDSTSEMMKLTQQQRAELGRAMAEERQELQQKLENSSLSEEQRKSLEQKMEALEQLAQKLQMSDDVKKALQELQNMKEIKEMQEAMRDMQQMQEKLERGEMPTDEDIERMQKAMEELAKQMQDPEMRKLMQEAMKEMVEAMKSGQISAQQLQGMLSLLGMDGGLSGPGSGGEFKGEGENQKGDPMSFDAGGKTTAIRGDRDENRGQDSYQEIKAPTTVGGKTSVPYSKVLPQYRETAESAVSNNQVKARHRKRVKDYFESLSGGK